MKIGIIGTGTVGKTLALMLSAKGHQVLVANSRGPEGVVESLGASSVLTPSSTSKALACDLIFLTVPWTKVPDVLRSGGPRDGRILVDTTNIFLSYPPDARVDDLKGDSGSEIVARLAPAARVVKAFNTLPFATMFALRPDGMKRVLFVAGDDAPAVAIVASLVAELGLHPVPLGSLAQAGRQMELGGPLSGLELLTPVKGAA
jgi:8-hydroxy-5-deazaflavin:NADPH oxidoreductase